MRTPACDAISRDVRRRARDSDDDPTLEEAKRMGAVPSSRTEEWWRSLSPGMRKDIVASKSRRSSRA